MHRVPIAIAALTALIGTSAFAADMAVKAPPPPQPSAAPAYSWTGFYIGGNAGYGWSDPTVSVTPNDGAAFFFTCLGGGFPPGGTCIPPPSFNIGSALGGLQAGYNWQVSQNWLFGLETDFDWSNIKGTGSSNFLLDGLPSNFQASENVKWFGTVRGRIGFLPLNNVLLYAAGGFAYGHVDAHAAINSLAPNPGGFGFGFNCTAAGGPGATNCFVGNSSRAATGFAVGAGGEYMLWNNISVKLEYLYVDLGHGNAFNVVAQNSGGPFPASSFTAGFSRVDFNTVRAGLNWKFY
jgi:outer membrane immunogenic protein